MDDTSFADETFNKDNSHFNYHVSKERFGVCASTVIAIVAGSLTIAALHDLPEYCDHYDQDGKALVKTINIMLLIQSGLMLLYGLMSSIISIRHCACDVSVDEPGLPLASGSRVYFYDTWAKVCFLWWALPGLALAILVLLLRNLCHRPDWFHLSVAIVNVTLFTNLGICSLGFAGIGICGVLGFAGMVIYGVLWLAFSVFAVFCSAMGFTCIDDSVFTCDDDWLW